MCLAGWKKFSWDLSQELVFAGQSVLPFVFRIATVDDEEAVRQVVRSAFASEPRYTGNLPNDHVRWPDAIESAFAQNPPTCVVALHGNRVIGASVINPSPNATNHLPTGPCVLNEYRNRRIGVQLLADSLKLLTDYGVSIALTIAPAHSLAARFIYPKSGAVEVESSHLPKAVGC